MSPATREKLIVDHMKEAKSYSRRWQGLGVANEDLEQEAYGALCRAADLFDSAGNPGVAFMAYARNAIKGALCDAVRYASATTVPPRVALRARQARRVRSALTTSENPRPSVSQIAAALGLSGPVTALALSLPRACQLEMDFDEPSSQSHPGIEHATGELWSALEVLGKEERSILVSHYGLDGQLPLDVFQIADWKRLSVPRIRAILKTAIERLRQKLLARGWHRRREVAANEAAVKIA